MVDESCFKKTNTNSGLHSTFERRKAKRKTVSLSEMTRTDAFLVVCRFFSVITAVTAILCVVVNVLSAIRAFSGDTDIFDGIFRCYAVLIACFVVVAETEWQRVLQYWKVLDYWIGRGMLIIFVAVMTRAFPYTADQAESLILLQSIASYMLMACGVIYLISGLFGLGCLKRNREKKQVTREQTREQAARDLDELDRRREELQALLLAQGQAEAHQGHENV